LRLYVEANRDWNKACSSKLGIEYLPNFTISSDYQLNLNLSGTAAITEIFALKSAYEVKYRNVPVAPAVDQTDTQFTTAIVAKF
jgi:putative salt-induced outer membrane protein YdiY